MPIQQNDADATCLLFLSFSSFDPFAAAPNLFCSFTSTSMFSHCTCLPQLGDKGFRAWLGKYEEMIGEVCI